MNKMLVSFAIMGIMVLLMLSFVMSVKGQVITPYQDPVLCKPEFCKDSIHYFKCEYDKLTRRCICKEEKCLYGCDDNGISCRDMPVEPPQELPENDTLARKIQYDLTRKIYQNQRYSIDLLGTEYYYAGQPAKIMIQLKDGTTPINNATCFVTVYYPNMTKWLDNESMINLEDAGVFFIDVTIPDVEGNYMISIFCISPSLTYNYTCWNRTYDGFESGDFSGGYGWADAWYTDVDVTITSSDNPYNGSYHMRLIKGQGFVKRPVNNLYETDPDQTYVGFWAKARSFEPGEEAYFYFWDGSYHLLQTWTTDNADNIYHYYQFNLSEYKLGNNMVGIEAHMGGGDDYLYIDDIVIHSCEKNYYYSEQEQYQEIRGGGDIHVTNLPEKIWEYFATMPEPRLVSNHDVCADNMTLVKELRYEICIDNKCRIITRNETIPCDYGCYNNRCLPDPATKYLYGIIISGVIGLIIYLIWRFGVRE